jgi:hypothetical protein
MLPGLQDSGVNIKLSLLDFFGVQIFTAILTSFWYFPFAGPGYKPVPMLFLNSKRYAGTRRVRPEEKK